MKNENKNYYFLYIKQKIESMDEFFLIQINNFEHFLIYFVFFKVLIKSII